jgi:hypothetical protein
MTDKVYIYGAGAGYNINYELRAPDSTLLDSGVATETAPLSGIYHATVSGSTPVGYYDMLAYYQSGLLGATNFYWTGSQVLNDNEAGVITLLQTLLKYEKNRTRIDKTAKTLTVYDDDGTTPIKVFSLRDENGVPSITEIIERLPQ